MNLNLRPATPADATQLAAILIDSCAQFMPYAPSAHPDEAIHQVAHHLIPSGGVTVAQIDAPVIGLVATEHAGFIR
ncbi:hypothetical protein R0381_003172 [Jeongeupia wiesaeckerbachi]|uniref:hypothetical protein n=1 Tax=Jeongeupia wiesaeckerbachi TaxID=3051218 RepID=UPI003D806485